MKKLAVILTVFLMPFCMKAQPGEQLRILEQANQSYSNADYETAVSLYESITNAGYESAELYFNLGNAHFKVGNIPAAILYYEKAAKLDPTDENIRFNLELANSRIIDKLEPIPPFFLKTWWKSVRDIFTSDQWAKTGVLCFLVLLASSALFIISSSVLFRKLSFWAGVIFLAFMSLSLIFSINSYHDYTRKSSAIIFTATVTVKSSPNENSVDLFVIHEGTKVYITDLVEDWSEVRLSNGSVGWIRKDHYKPI